MASNSKGLASAARSMLGVIVKDLPRYLPSLARGGDAYLTIRNRDERLEVGPEKQGYRCDWKWTSELHAPKIIPALGRAMLRKALKAHPVLVADAASTEGADPPDVSFIIGHRGMQRLPHLLATLRSIAAQQGVSFETIVVEQDSEATLSRHVPQGVRVIHTPSTPQMPYNRSWAFNAGVKHARGQVLVLHDNDMLIPVDYAAAIAARIRAGYEVVNAKRFIFYLTQAHSEAVMRGDANLLDHAPESIVQNLEGGGSVAITRAAYEAIGGMDESFVGWGGEDNEFWERALTRRTWTWGSMPIVHLWHAAQPGKRDSNYATAVRYRNLSPIDPVARIAALRAKMLAQPPS